MKRSWAVILTVATLAGCRTNQPATNPFMRTTVQPPTTTPGVMVTPGQPYAQGISPPLVTQPAPVITTPPPVTTQPVPVTPAPPVAAPMTAPPSVAPQGDQFRYPGGSYIFHQSSNDPPPASPDVGGVQLASASMPVSESPANTGVSQATYVEPARVHISGPMSPAPIIENPYVKTKNEPLAAAQPQVQQSQDLSSQPTARPLIAEQPKSAPPRTIAQSHSTAPPKTLTKARTATQVAAPTRLSLGASRGDPPDKPGFEPVSAGSNTLRIVGESSPPAASALVASTPSTQMAIAPPAAPAPSSGSVMRITAGNSSPAIRSTVETAAASTTIKSNPAGSTTARIVSPSARDGQDVIQTSFEPAGSTSTISISPTGR